MTLQRSLGTGGVWIVGAGAARNAVLGAAADAPRLRDRFTPHLGAKTGANELFLDPPASVEAALVRLAVRGRDVRAFTVADGPRLLWPCDAQGRALEKLPPGARAHLAPAEARLRARADYDGGPPWTLVPHRGGVGTASGGLGRPRPPAHGDCPHGWPGVAPDPAKHLLCGRGPQCGGGAPAGSLAQLHLDPRGRAARSHRGLGRIRPFQCGPGRRPTTARLRARRCRARRAGPGRGRRATQSRPTSMTSLPATSPSRPQHVARSWLCPAWPTIVAESLTSVAEPLATVLAAGSGRSVRGAVAAALAASLAPPESAAVPPTGCGQHSARRFARALAALGRYGGALLADPVGTGKTYVALAAAAAMNGPRPTVCLVPAGLREQWQRGRRPHRRARSCRGRTSGRAGARCRRTPGGWSSLTRAIGSGTRPPAAMRTWPDGCWAAAPCC